MAATLEEFEKAIKRLEDALAKEKDEFIRDSVIQRYEFTFELSWKTAKKVMGSSSVAPKIVIREMAAQGFIENPQTWFQYTEARNMTSHTYKEDTAEDVYKIAKESVIDFKKLLEKLKAI